MSLPFGIGTPGGRAAALSLAILVIESAGPLHADSRQTGIIDGRVLDAAGRALAGIAVTLASDRGELDAVTDDDGRFLFGRLPPGDYVARVAVADFGSADQATSLETGERRTLDLRLELASADRIDVVSTAPAVDRNQASASSTLDAEVAAQLVFATRNFQALISALPGVVNEATSLAELVPAVNGGLWQEHAGFLDGVDITDTRFGGGIRVFLPASALATVRTDASGYGAEYGRVVGGVTGVITKSGTNEFQGELLLVAQNPSWREQSEVVAVERDDRVTLSHEATLGGPILRDRVWFFAASGDTTTNSASSLASGEVIDSSFETESLLGKVAFDASPRHRVTVTGIDTLGGTPVFLPTTAERLAASVAEREGFFIVAGWDWTAGRETFVEARAARQRQGSDRVPIAVAAIQPGASPDDPAGNRGTYWDNASGLRWHASDLPLGPGSLEFPRDQANVSFMRLLGAHEIELGADYQDMGWEALNRPPDRYLGRSYDPRLPGGFREPDLKRIFLPVTAPVGTASTNLALFAQDRMELGDHWTVSVGLRLEDQAHEDDRGKEVLASTDLAPRAAVVYDVGAAGRLLLKATAGRYVTHIAQDFINQEFSSLSNGANAFDEYRFNPATQRYDLFNRRQLPSSRSPVEDVEPYYKDEVTAGIEWQMTRAWALDARAIAWRVEAPFSATDQFDANGAVYRLLTNFDAAERRYRGLQIEANRALRDGFAVRANYTLSRVEGNSTADDFLEAMAVLDPATGEPVTAVNRFGRLDNDRTHILNLAGAKRFSLGARHGLALGGWLAFRTGQPWASSRSVALRLPTTATAIVATQFIEPRGAHELPDTHTLHLTAAWEFPIAGRTAGSLRAELVNATDEQEQVAVSAETGEPVPVPQSFQTPRELRLLAGLRF